MEDQSPGLEHPVKKNAPQDFFLHLVMFLSLSFVAFGEGNILFQFINKLIPGPDNSYSNTFDQGSVKFGIAALFIAAPLFFFISRIISGRISSGLTQLESPVRRWLTYVVLFFAASTILGDLIALIVNFLNGDYTASFLLQMCVILLIAGSIFGYYFWDMRRKVLDSSIIRKSALAYAMIILITFIAAFFVIDSPSVSRQKRIDLQTVNDIQSVDSSVRNYFNQSGKLPDSLAGLEQTGFSPFLSKKGSVTYEIVNENSYKLCAEFVRSDLLDERSFSEPISDQWHHDAGRICFERIALKGVVPSAAFEKM